MKKKSDVVICWTRRLLSRDRHVIIMWLFGSVRTRLTFCGSPHASMSNSSMLIAATGRCPCLQIWIQKFTVPKHSQSQHSWRPFPLCIYAFMHAAACLCPLYMYCQACAITSFSMLKIVESLGTYLPYQKVSWPTGKSDQNESLKFTRLKANPAVG